MYSPSTRLLTVLELLQTHGGCTGPELASRLEVDVRSVRRYISMLRDMGIPVESEPGRYGLYRLRPGFRMPPLMFTNHETLAVILGLMAVRRLGMAATLGVESASAKIERVLPDELREQVRALQGVLTLNINAYPSAAEEKLSAFSLSAYQSRQLWMSYEGRSQEYTERVVDVYGLIYHGGAWYTVAYCHLREDLRIFRLDRVSEAKLLESTFEPPEDFDALKYLLDSIATMPAVWNIEVLLRTTMEAAQERITPGTAVLEEMDGCVILRMWADGLNWAARYLIWIGLPFEVIHPPELKNAIRELMANVVRMTEI
jgi:predicted DNA-binding transcriptional regulator YafY